MFQIRPCRPEDFDPLTRLLAQLWPDGPPDPAAARGVFDRALASDSQVYLCATTADGRLVGFGSLTLKNTLWPAGPIGNVDELVVDAASRGRGVGTRLLERLAAAARERGCRRLELDSAFHRAEAHAFYERHGFEKRAYLFSKPL